jgi:hypothetical protein
MRVPEHHFVAAPATKLHQHVQRRSTHDVTTRPRVAKIVASKIRHPGSFQSVPPSLGVHARGRFSEVGEHTAVMLPHLSIDHYMLVLRWWCGEIVVAKRLGRQSHRLKVC